MRLHDFSKFENSVDIHFYCSFLKFPQKLLEGLLVQILSASRVS